MSETKFKVGDRVRCAGDIGVVKVADLDANGHIVVLVGHLYEPWPAARCELVPTFPEAWINVYCDGSVNGSESRERADRMGFERIGVIHLHPDGTVTMEQP